jgi:hypothetical protein
VACALGGCSLITSTDGLRGGAPSSTVDAGDAAPKDGADPGPDAPPPSDGGLDATRPAKWELVASSGPSGRHSTSMAFDGTGVVLFGGARGQGDSLLADTWRWDGAAWSKLDAFPSPRSTFGHTLLAAKNAEVWMLLGRSNDDTAFSWDGSSWAPKLGGNPTNRTTAAAFDSDRGVVVALDLDTTDRTLRHWEYDGTTWKSVAVVTPPERRGARMVYDTFRKRVVLFGGRELQNDTWEYGSGAWSKRSPATSPSSRHGFCMAYDPSRRLTVLFGGAEGGNTLVGSETWEYDGETWRRGPDGPPTRRSCAMTYDPKKGRIMMFGGVYPVSGDGGFWNGARDDTWLY